MKWPMRCFRRSVPFAFATGDSGANAAHGFGEAIVLHKPFDFEAVKAVLGKLLQRGSGRSS